MEAFIGSTTGEGHRKREEAVDVLKETGTLNHVGFLARKRLGVLFVLQEVTDGCFSFYLYDMIVLVIL